MQLSRGTVMRMGMPPPHALVAGTLSGTRSDHGNIIHPYLILY